MKKTITASKAVKLLEQHLVPFQVGSGKLKLQEFLIDEMIVQQTGLRRWMWGFDEKQLETELRKAFPSVKRIRIDVGYAESDSFYLTCNL